MYSKKEISLLFVISFLNQIYWFLYFIIHVEEEEVDVKPDIKMTNFGAFVLSDIVLLERFTEEFIRFNTEQGRVTPDQILYAFKSEIIYLKEKHKNLPNIATTVANGDGRAEMEKKIRDVERAARGFIEFARRQGNVFLETVNQIANGNFQALYQGCLARWQEQDRRDRTIETHFGAQQRVLEGLSSEARRRNFRGNSQEEVLR